MPQAHGPWQILESHSVYRDPWLEVRRDDVIRPDGLPGTHGVILLRPGVSVLLLDDEGFVYLTDEFHYAVGRRTLEVVSGGVEDVEEPLAAAQREAREELGISARDWIDLGCYDPFTTMVSAPARLFLARGLSVGESRPDGTEQIRRVRVSFDDAVAMVFDSRITHGPSAVVILKARLYLEGERGAQAE